MKPFAGTKVYRVMTQTTRQFIPVILAMLTLVSLPAFGQVPLPGEREEAEPLPPIELETLVEQSEVVALAQVLDVDYEYTRDFPTGGTAFLQLLIRYKVPRVLPNIIEVYEEGLHPHECYFPNPSVIEEGQRFLVFLRANPEVDGQWLGMPEGCKLAVLVTDENRYALRFPLKGIDIVESEALAAAAQPIEFADAHAVLSIDDLTVAERDALLESGQLEKRDDGNFKLTQGIMLGDFRALVGPDRLTTDRALLRPAVEE